MSAQAVTALVAGLVLGANAAVFVAAIIVFRARKRAP